MANGDFLRDLSSGIFTRLGELRKQQEGRDESRRSEVLSLLSGLADKVEPGSLPVLLGHMGEVMKLQGPMKKFWQAFSGMPDRGFEDQLGTKLGEFNKSLIGPEEARQARETYKGELIKPFREAGTRPRSVEALPYKTPPSLAGRAVLRDPRAEKLTEIEQRYGQQNEMNLYKLGLQQDFNRRQQEDRQKHALDLEAQRSQNRAAQDQMRLAGLLVSAYPHKYNMAEAEELAGKMLLGKDKAQVDKILAQIGLIGDQRAKLRTETEFIGKYGMKPSDLMSQRRFDAAQQGEFRKLQLEHRQSVEAAKSIPARIKAKEQQLDAYAKLVGGTFRPGGTSFEGEDEIVKSASAYGQGKKLLDEYQKLLDEEKQARGKMETVWQQMRNQFDPYATFGTTPWDVPELKPEFGGVAPSGAPRKTATPPPKATLPGAKTATPPVSPRSNPTGLIPPVGKQGNVRITGAPLSVGEETTVGGVRVKILGILAEPGGGKDGVYRVQVLGQQ